MTEFWLVDLTQSFYKWIIVRNITRYQPLLFLYQKQEFSCYLFILFFLLVFLFFQFCFYVNPVMTLVIYWFSLAFLFLPNILCYVKHILFVINWFNFRQIHLFQFILFFSVELLLLFHIFLELAKSCWVITSLQKKKK